MLWINPTEIITADSDALIRAKHNGIHYLYYNPSVSVSEINSLDNLNDICTRANFWLARRRGVDLNFTARLVNINRFAQTLPLIGCVKPMLLFYQGGACYEAATGGTRLLAAQALKTISSVPAFISTHDRWKFKFAQLEEVTSIDRYRELCNSPDCTVNLRITNSDDPVGIDWFEITSTDQRIRVYSDEVTTVALENYLQTQPQNFKFSPEWFATTIEWF
jgi:hypothetical protein